MKKLLALALLAALFASCTAREAINYEKIRSDSQKANDELDRY